MKSLLAKMDISSSNGEDFRSVIDDLIKQNQKLKKKPKKYVRLHCSHLQDPQSAIMLLEGETKSFGNTLKNLSS